MNALARELFLAGHVALQRVGGVEESDGECGARSDSTASRQIAIVMNLETALDLEVAEHRTGGRMLDVADRLTILDDRIHKTNAMFEEGREKAAGDIAVF